MRKFLALILTLTLVCSFSACKKESSSSEMETSSLTTQTASKTDPDNTTSTENTDFVEPKDYAVALQLSINPQFKIYLDKNLKAIKIKPLNDDAIAILSDYRYIGNESFETIVDSLISKGKEKGYVKRNSPVNIGIFYMNKKTVDVEEMNNRLNNLTKAMSQKYNAIVKFKAPSDIGDSTASSNNSTTNSRPSTSKPSASTSTPTPTHTHSFSAATCTAPKACSCGATEGQALGHNYKNGKCSRCGSNDPNFREFDAYINGVGYTLGQVLTVDIVLKTNDTDIDVCPCFTTYKRANNNWGPYDMMTAGFEDFWGEEPTIQSSHGAPMETDDGIYGHWCWMGTRFTEKDESFNFSQGNVIRRLKFKVTEKGEFEFRIQDGQHPEQNNNKYTNALSVKVY